MRPTELKPFLERAFRNKRKVLIKSAPGNGKSDIVEQACAAIQHELIISHPSVSDPTDYKGMPAILPDTGAGPRAEFLPFGDLNKLIEAKQPTIAFLDDIGQAPPAVQAALMQLILARRVNGHKISEYVVFCAATNDTKHLAGVGGMLEPVKSRFDTIVELSVSVDDWSIWAFEHQMPTELIAFIRFRQDLLSAFTPTRELKNSPCPRTVASVGNWLNENERSHEVLAGAAGEAFANELLAFLTLAATLPNLDEIIMNPDSAPIPDQPSTLYAVVCGLARKTTVANAERVFRYLKRLPQEFEVCCVKDAIRLDRSVIQTRPYTEWAARNGQVLS